MKLKKYLKENNIKLTDFAKTTNYSKGNLSMICNGKMTPSFKTALKIQKATNNRVMAHELDNILEKSNKYIYKSSIPQDGSGFIDENVTKTFEKTNKNDLHQENVLENV
jgi:transcriptional regulator with XRE-family HTH domain